MSHHDGEFRESVHASIVLTINYASSNVAAFQTEGNVKVDGRGVSVWDTWSHNTSVCCEGGLNADTAADSYVRYPEDLAIMKSLKAQAYRFSISWTRIYPQGNGAINQPGIDFYNTFIDAIIAADMIPIATMYHVCP